MTAYPHLLQPFPLGPLMLKSRVVMGAMHTGLEERGDWAAAARFYARRAQGGVGLIITGGVAPNPEGAVFPGACGLYTAQDVANHRQITSAVHAEGGLIAMQILHAGRYARGADCVSSSAIKSPISPFAPLALNEAGIEKQIADIAACALRAQEAGYDGVEVMGSEGYFLNQFTAPRVNRRTDGWGGAPAARMRLPLAVVDRIRKVVGRDLLLIYRISLADLVPDGSLWEDTAALARAMEPQVDLFTSGFGWHESRVPTIAASVPRGAFVGLTARLRQDVSVPVVAANRINTPELAEAILAKGHADLVALARPLLADPDFVAKARAGRSTAIAPCIACNQACLDHTFAGKLATCIVNPAACREAAYDPTPTARPLKIAVVGGGAAGMACAVTAAKRGHKVVLFEQAQTLGGQMQLAARVPGKEEFVGLLAWFEHQLSEEGVELRLGQRATPEILLGFDKVVLATGLIPHRLDLPGTQDAPDYAQMLQGTPLGPSVAVIGAGGIGFDVATALVTQGAQDWSNEWGLGDPATTAGGLTDPTPTAPTRKVWLLQRKAEKPGKGLGKTTGWIHRAHLAAKGVQMWGGVTYDHFDAQGLHILRDGQPQILPVNDVVICAGQDANLTLAHALTAAQIPYHLIGGAADPQMIDAKRAIDEGTRLGLSL